ncbi:hypothetical protein INT45_005129 [Circinella minor]|uniref:Uncharacterized protein n=1 Tax=Circinella minor TaxID=1195481 RepID=A0A8H7VS07_9FUNG|nr:hypothetical protein INT45_005129 [Circinella minor]
MSAVGERDPAREERNAEPIVAVKQENAQNRALEMEDRILALEARNAELVNRVEAMSDIIARQVLAQQEAPSVVNQVGTAIPVQNVPVGRLPTVSDAIRKRNQELGSEGFDLSAKYTATHNRVARLKIMSYIQDLQTYGISREDLSKKVYTHFDNERTKQRLTPERAAVRKTSNRRNGRRHTKCKRRRGAFARHQTELESCFPGGEALLQVKYMSEEDTDDEYPSGIGKRVVVKKLQWLNEKGKRFFARLDELHPPTPSIGLLRVEGVSNVVLNDDEQQQLKEWVVDQ